MVLDGQDRQIECDSNNAAVPATVPVVVIIDDDDAVRDSTKLLLESCGYSVRDHDSAENFLASDFTGISCLLVDHHMPGMSGAEFLERLRAKGDRTPALMVTGRADEAIEARMTRIAVSLLQKPVDEDELIKAVERLLQP